MKRFILLMIFCGMGIAYGQNTAAEKPSVAILGMFHFGGSSDLASIVMEDVMGAKRQGEIQELVDRLKKYQPTRVLVEVPLSLQDTLQSRYQHYKSGDFTLPKSETYQVGFRLANQLGHDSIYAVDHKLDMPFEQIMAYCKENDQMGDFQHIVNLAQQYTQGETAVLKEMELAPFLKRMNGTESDQFGNGIYLREILNIGDSQNEVGAAVSAVWYQRNMVILKNIAQHIKKPNERVLVIMGASHRAILNDYLRNRTEYELVEIGDYLD